MLGKLIKYDMRAQAKLLFPLSLISFAISAVGAGVLVFMHYALNSVESYEGAVSALVIMAQLFCSSFVGIAVIASFVGFAAATVVMLVIRFCSSQFSDQGYLTFTLPCTSHELLGSKTIVGMIWMIYAVVILFLNGAIYGVILQLTGVADVWFFIKSMFADMAAAGLAGPLFVIGAVLEIIAELLFALMALYLSFTIGAGLAKKARVLVGLAIYLGINSVYSTISSIGVFTLLGMPDIFIAINSVETIGQIAGIGAMVVAAVLFGLSAALYFITNYIFKNKINLA